jgi:hypothetical protein
VTTGHGAGRMDDVGRHLRLRRDGRCRFRLGKHRRRDVVTCVTGDASRYGGVSIEKLTDAQLYAIAAGEMDHAGSAASGPKLETPDGQAALRSGPRNEKDHRSDPVVQKARWFLHCLAS